MYIYNI